MLNRWLLIRGVLALLLNFWLPSLRQSVCGQSVRRFLLESASCCISSRRFGAVQSLDDRRWAVKLDVRDLGGHLDTTYRASFSTLVSAAFCALP